jgi:uncharacterized HhH-GPD family protein
MTVAAWELVLEAGRSLTARGLVEFTRAQLLDEVRRRDASRRPDSLGPVIQGMIANAPGGPPSPCGTPLIRVGHGVYRLAGQSPATTPAAESLVHPARPAPRTAPAAEVVVAGADRVDIVLVGCVKTKADEPRPARLLYQSALFRKRRRYAETRGHRWYVLSAEHGLVHPDAPLEPYDVALAAQPDDYRHAWAGWVAAKLRRVEGNLRGRRIEIHAGQAYAAPLLPLLRAAGAHVTQPLAGLTQGQHLAWYDQRADRRAPDRAAPPAPARLPAGADEPAESWLSNIVILDGPHVRPGFTYRWPDQAETFTSVTELTIASAGSTYQVRIALCDREAYGSLRRRIVVFVGSAPVAEAVGVDDHHHSEALVGLLKDADGRMIRPGDPVPEVYAGFPLVLFSDEVSGPYTRGGLAVRLRENDVVSWSAFALARTAVRTGAPPAGPAPADRQAEVRSPARPASDQQAVVAALLQYGRAHQQDRAGREPEFTPHPEANRLIIDNPFAFLLAVILDEGIPAERAWRGPYELRLRLGHLDPTRIAAEPDAVRAAVARPPALHRYVNEAPQWLVRAATQVVSEYGGDTAAIWADTPRAADLAARLRRFHRIGQKKSAMAVEILARDLGVPVREFTGSDIAYDVHVRRVLLRTGLAAYDDPDHMIEIARRLHPERPGELDFPAWLIGRTWCGAGIPHCTECPLTEVCPRWTDAAAMVRSG